jgi:hypothetical protein
MFESNSYFSEIYITSTPSKPPRTFAAMRILYKRRRCLYNYHYHHHYSNCAHRTESPSSNICRRSCIGLTCNGTTCRCGTRCGTMACTRSRCWHRFCRRRRGWGGCTRQRCWWCCRYKGRREGTERGRRRSSICSHGRQDRGNDICSEGLNLVYIIKRCPLARKTVSFALDKVSKR